VLYKDASSLYTSAKAVTAVQWGVPLINRHWLLDSLEAGRLLDWHPYRRHPLDDYHLTHAAHVAHSSSTVTGPANVATSVDTSACTTIKHAAARIEGAMNSLELKHPALGQHTGVDISMPSFRMLAKAEGANQSLTACPDAIRAESVSRTQPHIHQLDPPPAQDRSRAVAACPQQASTPKYMIGTKAVGGSHHRAALTNITNNQAPLLAPEARQQAPETHRNVTVRRRGRRHRVRPTQDQLDGDAMCSAPLVELQARVGVSKTAGAQGHAGYLGLAQWHEPTASLAGGASKGAGVSAESAPEEPHVSGAADMGGSLTPEAFSGPAESLGPPADLVLFAHSGPVAYSGPAAPRRPRHPAGCCFLSPASCAANGRLRMQPGKAAGRTSGGSDSTANTTITTATATTTSSCDGIATPPAGSTTNGRFRTSEGDTPCSEGATPDSVARPGSLVRVWGPLERQLRSSAAAYHGVPADEVLFFQHLELDLPPANANDGTLRVDTLDPWQGVLLHYDAGAGGHTLHFAGVLHIYKLRSDLSSTWLEHRYFYSQEDIRQDRRGFGGHYLRKHPVRAPYELVGSPYTYHSSAHSLGATFRFTPPPAFQVPQNKATGQTEANRTQTHRAPGRTHTTPEPQPFFCSRAWDPFSGRAMASLALPDSWQILNRNLPC